MVHGSLYEVFVGHERLVGSPDQFPVPRQEEYTHTFPQRWHEGIAVGAHIVAHNLLVAHAV